LPAPVGGERGTAARVLPPRSGAEAGPSFSLSQDIPVLTHWATLCRPTG
jgi:hypothetical protein